MFQEKFIFDFTLFGWRFMLRQNFQYKDMETGKEHYNHVFKIRYEKETPTDYIIKDWVVFYTGFSNVECVYDTIDYEDARHRLILSLGWGKLYMHFPWKNKNRDMEDVNNPEPKYGFYLYGDGKFFDSFWYYTNKNGKSDVKCVYMPWSYEFYRHSILLKDGTWWTMLEKERRKARKDGIDTWKDRRYHLDDDDESILRRQYPFKYVTKGGEVQETTATCYLEEREWRPKWFMWTGLFKKVRTELAINFCDEMGNQKDTWKGGVIGVGTVVTKEERENADMESALRRYEEKVNNTKEYDR